MVKVSMEKLGANVRRLREERGRSVKELADQVWATEKFVSEAEAGKRNLTLEEVMTFCDAFGVQPSKLLNGILVDD